MSTADTLINLNTYFTFHFVQHHLITKLIYFNEKILDFRDVLLLTCQPYRWKQMSLNDTLKGL